MSNSFPSIISNEPPEFLSDEDDDDSEEYRNFSSGLKVDIDPSPVSSPRKSKQGHVSTPSPLSHPTTSLPNGTQIPPNSSSSSNDTVFQDNNNISTTTNQDLDQPNKITESSSSDDLSPLPPSTKQNFSNNKNNNNNNSKDINNVIKTSYIGTIESLDDDDDDVEEFSSESKRIQTELESKKTDNTIDKHNFVAFESNSQQSVPVIQQNTNEVKEENTEDSIEQNVSEDQYTPPESSFHSLSENKEEPDDDVNNDEFEDFQEFQTMSIQKVDDSIERDVINGKEEEEEETNTIYVESHCELDNVSPGKDVDTVLLNISIPEQLISSSTPEDDIKFEDASSSSSPTNNNNECTNQLNNDKDVCNYSTEVQPNDDFITESILSETISTKVKNEASSIVASDQITAQIDSDNNKTIDFQVDFSTFSDPSSEQTEIHKVDKVDDHSQKFDLNSDDDDFDNFQDFQTSSTIMTTTQNTTDSFQQISTSSNSLESSNTIVDSSSSSYGLESVNSIDTSQPSTTNIQNESDNHRQQPQIPSSSNLDSFIDDNKNKNEENNDDFDDFEDFQAFQSPPVSQSLPMPSVITTNATTTTNNNNNIVSQSTLSSSSSLEMSTSNVISSTTLTSMDGDTTPSQSNLTSSSLLENKFETLVKSLFPSSPIPNDEIPESVLNFKQIDKELKEDCDNQQWSRVEDFEGSQGLLFKWLNSCAYQKLLKSLKIDSSTIMYSGKWGPIPRFAASLVDSPLLPESGSKAGDTLSQINTESNSNPSKEITSPSENESGVGTEAAGGTSSKGTSGGQISQETEQIIARLPDLSYMRSKTLVFPNILQVQTLTRDV